MRNRTTTRIENILLGRLRRRERRFAYDRAVDAGLLSQRHHSVGCKRVTSYVVTAPLMAMAWEELEGLVPRIMSSTEKTSFEDLQGPPVVVGSADTRRTLGDSPQLQRLLQQYVKRAPIADSVLALSIAEAVVATKMDLPTILSTLKRNQFRLLISLPTADSASCLKTLILDGILGGEPGEREEQGWRGLSESITIARFSTRNVVIIDLEKVASEKEMQRRFDRAVRDGDSIVFLSAATEPSAWVRAAVDLFLAVDKMSPKTMGKLIALQTGENAAACSQIVDSFWNGSENLCLLDIAAAMSTDRTPVDIVSRLNALQSYRQNADQRDKADQAESGTASGRKSKSETWIEVIQPEPLFHVPAPQAKRPLRVDDLHGYGSAKDWALELAQDLEVWRKGKISWADMSTKILLHGPPGTGKTTFARALPNTLTVPLLITSVASWLEPGYLGDVVKRIRQTFRLAQESAPCILFVDELDGISKRDGGGSRNFDDYWVNVVNRLLECLDGALKSEGVIFVGATNRPEAIDPALLRSGRIEERVQISLPNLVNLTAILKYHLYQSDQTNSAFAAFDNDDELQRLCARMIGTSGADVEKTVKLARAKARREQRDLQVSDLEASIDLHRPPRSASLTETFAIHEAGHAVAYAVLGVAMAQSISVADPGGGRTSLVFTSDQMQFEDGLQNTITALLAGREAERLCIGRIAAGSGGSSDSDLARATALAIRLEGSLGFGSEMPLFYRNENADVNEIIYDPAFTQRANRRLEQAEEHARQLVKDHASGIKRLADMLQKKLVIEGDELTEILKPLRPTQTPDSVRFEA